MNSINKKRNDCLDVAKGLGIIMVVWVHCSGPLSSYMSQFHMPLFFIISGFLFNSENSLTEFVIKKIKNLYIPFVTYNLLATVIMFIVNRDFLLNNSKIKTILEIFLTLNKNGQFFGATWFLGSLFVCSIMYKVLYTCLKDYKYKMHYITIFFIVMAIIGFEITFPYMISRTLILSMFYAIGYIIKVNVNNIRELINPIIFISSLVIYIIIASNNSVDLGRNKYNFRFLFVIGAVYGSYIIVYFSKIIANWKKGILKNIKIICCFLGLNSMDILIWHFIAFRIVIAIQLKLDNISFKNILDYYPIYNSKNGWWLIYTIIGISISLSIGKILQISTWKNKFLH